MSERKLFQKSDLFILAACLLLAGAACLPRVLSKSTVLTAVITADNEIVTEITLSGAPEQTIEINGTTITVKDAAVYFSESDCPDGICVKTGILDRAGESAACVPNRVSIYIKGEKSDVDAVAY